MSMCRQLLYTVTVVGCLAICCSAQNSGVCSRTRYRQKYAPETYTVYRTETYTSRYSCGFLWSRRCRRTHTRPVAEQRSRLVSHSESYIDHVCCSGYIGTPPNCIITCPVLRNPANGNVDYTSNVYPSEASYHCNLGYALNGSSSRTCESNGKWTGSQPSCRAIVCSVPTQPVNGQVSFTSTYYNGVAHYSCYSGYKLVGSSNRACTRSGEWSGALPSCRRLQCPPLTAPDGGSVTVSSYYPSGTGTYTCDYGYKMVGETPVRFCRSIEEWTGIAPECQQIRCSSLSQPDNGTMQVTSNTVDGVASFYCLPTHDLEGSDHRVCGESGKWNGTQPECVEKCTPFIGFKESYLRIKEGETKEVCLKTCSSCDLSSNFTLEVKAVSQDDVSEKVQDLIVPSEVTVNKDSLCFEMTAVDDDQLEGFEAKTLFLYKHNNERYNLCDGRTALPVSVVDNDELTIGFEQSSIKVSEGVGSTEVCVVISEPNKNVPIPDVVVHIRTWYFGEAKEKDDYIPIERLSLPLSDSNRKACFPVTITDDTIFEPDEDFSIFVERDSKVDLGIPWTIEPAQATLNILDDDGISIGFEGSTLSVEEGGKDTVCIKTRFSSPDITTSFSVLLNSRSLTAEENGDFRHFSNIPIGPFTTAAPVKCVSLDIVDDNIAEQEELFTLEISGEPDYIAVVQRVILVTIVYDTDDEPMTCDSPLKSFFPDLFEHCTDCEYPAKCTNWEEIPDSIVEVPKEKCPSKEMGVKSCLMNATDGDDCKPKEKLQASCVPTIGEKLASEIGAGSGISTRPHPEQTTSSPPRAKRQTSNGGHCYKPHEALVLNPMQCNAFPTTCPYANEAIRSRDPKASCTNRSVLFAVDSSHSVGSDLFREISVSLSHFVKNLCGDIQFGLLKFSTNTFLEFCFDCYSNNQRDELQERIIQTEFSGYSSFTGYATRCVNSFLFGKSNSCGNHEGRCVDIVFVTDGQSSDRKYINVCDQVECLHKNPLISDQLNVYVVNIGDTTTDETECMTKYSKLRDGQPPIFHFKSIDDLIIELNTIVRLIGQDQQKHRESARKLDYQCLDWFKV